MSELKVTGKVKTVFPTETKGNFSFRVLWLIADHESQYPQTLEVQFAKEKGDLLNNVKEGDIVEVDFNLRGRVWNNGTEDKVFNTISGWRLNVKEKGGTTPVYSPVVESTEQTDSQLPF